jgi:hypothetical protein
VKYLLFSFVLLSSIKTYSSQEDIATPLVAPKPRKPIAFLLGDMPLNTKQLAVSHLQKKIVRPVIVDELSPVLSFDPLLRAVDHYAIKFRAFLLHASNEEVESFFSWLREDGDNKQSFVSIACELNKAFVHMQKVRERNIHRFHPLCFPTITIPVIQQEVDGLAKMHLKNTKMAFRSNTRWEELGRILMSPPKASNLPHLWIRSFRLTIKHLDQAYLCAEEAGWRVNLDTFELEICEGYCETKL